MEIMDVEDHRQIIHLIGLIETFKLHQEVIHYGGIINIYIFSEGY